MFVASDNRFPRDDRLLKPSAFQHVFDQPGRSADRYLTVLFRSNDLDHARLGLAISKRQIRLAVDRNRLKRLIRESFRSNKSSLGAVDIVVMARRAASEASGKTLTEALHRHWHKLAAEQASKC